MYPTPTSHVDSVDFVMLYIVAISVILLLGITATMIYFVFRFNRKKGHAPVDIHGNVWLEITWIVIPTILVLSMFYFGYTSFREIRDIPANPFIVKVTARMWQFSFEYPNAKKTDTLYVPNNIPIKLELQSADVNHAFFIPAFRIKEDAIHGKINYLYFTPRETGSYDVACAEYCGLSHAKMYTKVIVVDSSKFVTWYGGEIQLNKTAGSK